MAGFSFECTTPRAPTEGRCMCQRGAKTPSEVRHWGCLFLSVWCCFLAGWSIGSDCVGFGGSPLPTASRTGVCSTRTPRPTRQQNSAAVAGLSASALVWHGVVTPLASAEPLRCPSEGRGILYQRPRQTELAPIYCALGVNLGMSCKLRSALMKLYFAPGACSLSPHIVLLEAGYNFPLEQVNNQEKNTK